MARIGDRRGLVFAGVVVAIAAVGIYLSVRSASDDPDEPRPTTGAVVSTAPAAPSSGVRVPSPVRSGAFDIYAYLPLSKDQIAQAADAAQRFAVAYATYRWDEDPASYAERLKAFTTADLGTVLARDVTSPATVERNRADQVVSEGSARLKEIRDIAGGSIVFVVTAVQRITAKSGPQERGTDYAVTLTQVGSQWQVYDMQPAEAGQDGDPGGGTAE
ncbi:hypothetical protein Skr01_45250 [Sphaerisporangium krabiense]|uniref:Mce-associated membrane protein n=1 Tax=Sphaerisporangium krabiense TaxID=763782 RepID=A0A7W8Z4R1_9ACTN|nr:hypothetical protein [Sphaerisporangium krabiense]MBB5627423.1 hypothetical protein [Sphaerisporangium krabiense]GII64440.1 hypothetical protein Skr01_45250 [Sphaerisporangium krabiense]